MMALEESQGLPNNNNKSLLQRYFVTQYGVKTPPTSMLTQQECFHLLLVQALSLQLFIDFLGMTSNYIKWCWEKVRIKNYFSLKEKS